MEKITVCRKKAKKITVSLKKAKILTVNRKSHYPIETLFKENFGRRRAEKVKHLKLLSSKLFLF